MHYKRDIFELFLKSIDLDSYRKLYSPIKIVEMDLDKPVSIIPTEDMYKLYGDSEDAYRNIPSFDEFYDYYYKNNENNINIFWSKSGFGMDCDCFQRGLKARIYRTWASIITQIYAGYVAEEVFGVGNVFQSSELDKNKIDILVKYRGKELKFQIKKFTGRKEIARMSDSKEKAKQLIYLYYEVISPEDYANPKYKRTGKYRPVAKQYIKFKPKTGFLDRYDNGFVVFTTKKFEYYKNKIDSELISN